MRLLDVILLITYQSHRPTDKDTIYGQPLCLLTSPLSCCCKMEEVRL